MQEFRDAVVDHALTLRTDLQPGGNLFQKPATDVRQLFDEQVKLSLRKTAADIRVAVNERAASDADKFLEVSPFDYSAAWRREQDGVVMDAAIAKRTTQALEGLSVRSQAAIDSRIFAERTLEDTGEDLGGVSRSRAAQIVDKAFRVLRGRQGKLAELLEP